jgi:hypothetical protein
LPAVAAPKSRSRIPTDLNEALARQETPQVKWKAMLQIGGALLVLWVTAFVVVPFVGYWAVGAIGVLTCVAIGFGIYVWRLTSRSRAILDIMKQATDEPGRQRAIEALSSEGGGGDAMKALAKAQLLAQTDPVEAQRTLEAIDIKKAPALLQDDVRAQLGMLYLRNNRTREARVLVDEMRLDRRPDAKSKALYAAVMAEAFARSGSPDEARKLLETYNAEEYEDEVRVMLLRAQVYAFMALKKRGLAKRAMDALCEVEPNLLGPFLIKGSPPEINKLARQTLADSGAAPKMKIKRM